MIKDSRKQPRLTGDQKVTMFEQEAKNLSGALIYSGHTLDSIVFSQLLNRFTYVAGRLRKARLSVLPVGVR
jgi:hypothetical protein